jgi:DNA polymerase
MNRLDVVERVLSCTKCELHVIGSAPVALKGPTPCDIAVVGEAPGEQEDRLGQPFVGPSGQLVDQLLTETGFDPSQMAWVNTTSCWPKGAPTWDHIHACDTNKWDQINLANPTYLLLFGSVALKAMRADLDIKRGRGRPFTHRNRICFATYHPAAALRNPNYLDSMRADLTRFRQLTQAGSDNWNAFIPDSCAACPIEPVWIEDSGIGWCQLDLTGEEKDKWSGRQHLLAAEIQEARHRRDEALARVESAAEQHWMDTAWEALTRYLETHPQFFVDDLWSTGLPEPRESRALGPVVLRAAREGLMRKSGHFRKSVRSNMTEKPVWTSLICGKST